MIKIKTRQKALLNDTKKYLAADNLGNLNCVTILATAHQTIAANKKLSLTKSYVSGLIPLFSDSPYTRACTHTS